MPAADFSPKPDLRQIAHAALRLVRRGWYGVAPALRSPSLPAVVAAVAILGLLLAFHQVVQGAVQQGELRRAAAAAQANAVRQCNALPTLRLRDDCLQVRVAQR